MNVQSIFFGIVANPGAAIGPITFPDLSSSAYGQRSVKKKCDLPTFQLTETRHNYIHKMHESILVV